MNKITSPANNASVPHGNILVQGISSAGLSAGGIKNVLVRADTGATIFLYTTAEPFVPGNRSKWSIILKRPTIGSERIQARATDDAGNQNWNSVTVTIT
jgi:hypothetical protein